MNGNAMPTGTSFPGQASTSEWLKRFTRPYLTISCGEWSYGTPEIRLADNDNSRQLTIGRYCSISKNVVIFCGRHGRHPTETLSTYPIHMAVSQKVLQGSTIPKAAFLPEDNLDVIIGDDVWIGTNVIIMAGVTIGTGAIIGAGAVVTKNVAPYSVVGGAPAKVLKMRHSEETIKMLIESKWWEMSPDELWMKWGSDLLTQHPTVLLSGYKNDELPYRVYRRICPDGDLPHWPDENIQKRYTGTFGIELMKRTLNFISMIEKDGALANGWYGLDYGCGWGRIASVMATKGKPEQLDLCDAWQESLDLVEKAGFRNSRKLISEILKSGDIPSSTYDFIYAFSIFTHLSEIAFHNNIKILYNGVKKGGVLYFTVRHQDFLDTLSHNPEDHANFEKEGILFKSLRNSNIYGDTIVSSGFIRNIAKEIGTNVRYIGCPQPMQHLYALGGANV